LYFREEHISLYNKRKRVTISPATDMKLKSMFKNNHEIGQFLTYVIEKVVTQLPDKTDVEVKVTVNVEDYKIK